MHVHNLPFDFDFDFIVRLCDRPTATVKERAALSKEVMKTRTPIIPYPRAEVRPCSGAASQGQGVAMATTRRDDGGTTSDLLICEVDGDGCTLTAHLDAETAAQMGDCPRLEPAILILLQFLLMVSNSTYPEGEGWRQVLFTSI